MTNQYYQPTGNPENQSRAQAAQTRSELALIAAGFDKLPNPADLQNNYLIDTGAANAYVVSPNTSVVTALTDGLTFRVKIANANTGAATLTLTGVAGAAAVPIARADGTALLASDLPTGAIVPLAYSTTMGKWQVFAPGAAAAAASATQAATSAAAAAVSASQAAASAAGNPLSSVAGTNTITGACAGITALGQGQVFEFIPANNNTAAATLNINGFGAAAIVKKAGTALASGDLVAGQGALVVYDGTRFQLLNPATAVVLGQMASSVGAAGYQKLPSGLIVQWGASATASGSVGVTFPLAFPNAAFSITATVNAATSTGAWGVVEIGATSTTGFTAYSSIYGTAAGGAANSAFGFNWIAIGN